MTPLWECLCNGARSGDVNSTCLSTGTPHWQRASVDFAPSKDSSLLPAWKFLRQVAMSCFPAKGPAKSSRIKFRLAILLSAHGHFSLSEATEDSANAARALCSLQHERWPSQALESAKPPKSLYSEFAEVCCRRVRADEFAFSSEPHLRRACSLTTKWVYLSTTHNHPQCSLRQILSLRCGSKAFAVKSGLTLKYQEDVLRRDASLERHERHRATQGSHEKLLLMQNSHLCLRQPVRQVYKDLLQGLTRGLHMS